MLRAFILALGLHAVIIAMLVFKLHLVSHPDLSAGNTMKAYVVVNSVAIGKQEYQRRQGPAVTALRSSGEIRANNISSNETTLHQGKYNRFLIELHNQIQDKINQQSLQIPDFIKTEPAIICFSISTNAKIYDVYFRLRSNLASFNTLLKKIITNLAISQQETKANASHFCIEAHPGR